MPNGSTVTLPIVSAVVLQNAYFYVYAVLFSLKRLLSYKVVHGCTPCHLLPFPPTMENEKNCVSLSIRLKTIN